MKYRPSCFIGFSGGIFLRIYLLLRFQVLSFTAGSANCPVAAVNFEELSLTRHGKYRLNEKLIC